MKPVIFFITALMSGKLCLAQLNLVKDINPGYYESSHPAVVGALSNGNVLLFATNTSDISFGSELWISDGTEGGTTMIKDIKPGSNGSVFPLTGLMVNDKLYFIANDGVHGRELWVSDGTTTGTFMLKDIWPGQQNGIVSDGPFTGYNGKIYFAANDSSHGTELWCTDGTTGGTNMVTDIWPGVKGSGPGGINAGMGKLFFSAVDSAHGLEYWYSDGTPGGTHLLHDIFPGTSNGVVGGVHYMMTFLNGNGYFTGRSSLKEGAELYATDGNNVWLVKDIDTNAQKSGNPHLYTIAGNKLFFKADHVTYGAELWVTDGTAAGTKLVKDITPGDIGSVYYLHGELKGKLLFGGVTNAQGIELWVSDGTTNGTYIIRDLFPGSSSGKLDIRSDINTKGGYNQCNLIYKNKYYFVGNDNSNDWIQLWVTDGTVAGTKKILCTEPPPPLPGIHLTSIDWIGVANNKVWVSMMPGANDYELYMYDIPPDNIESQGIMAKKLTVYPNPCDGRFVLELANNHFINGYLQIFDNSGKEVYSQSISKGTRYLPVKLHDVSKGIYHVSVKLDSDVQTCTIQIE